MSKDTLYIYAVTAKLYDFDVWHEVTHIITASSPVAARFAVGILYEDDFDAVETSAKMLGKA